MTAATTTELPAKVHRAVEILVHILGDKRRPTPERVAAGDAIEEALSWIPAEVPVDGHRPVPGTVAQARRLLLDAATEDTRAAAIIAYGLAARLLQDGPR